MPLSAVGCTLVHQLPVSCSCSIGDSISQSVRIVLTFYLSCLSIPEADLAAGQSISNLAVNPSD